MNRLILLTIIYWYSLSVSATDLFVQSRVVTDLYGDAYLYKLDARNVVYLDRQARQTDVTHAIANHVKAQSFTNVVMLGQYHSINAARHIPILTQFVLPAAIVKGPVYVLQGRSKLEAERKAVIEKQVKISKEYEIETDFDLRKALGELRSEPSGFVIINVFSLKDNWGEKRSYQSIEEVVTTYRTGHVDVGVCYPGFRTALAIGPTLDDVDLVLKGENSSSLCASLERLRRLGHIELYSQSSGKFYRVNSNHD